VQGEGTITATSILEGGDSKTITWSPKEGSEVVAVLVDGVIRDDLLEAGSYSFDGIEEDHTVEVLFKKTATGEGTDGETGEGTGEGTEGETGEATGEGTGEEEVKTYSTIRTSTQGQGTISNTGNIKNGSEYTVRWEPADGWKVAGVLIDDCNVDSLTDKDEVTLTKIFTDHKIRVIFVPEDGSEPGPAETIETSVTGGEGTITATGEALEGGEYTVTWEPSDGYEVAYVLVDGEKRTDLEDQTSITFTGVDTAHKVEVVFQLIKEEVPEETKEETKAEDIVENTVENTKARNATGNDTTVQNTTATETGDEAPILLYVVLVVTSGCLLYQLRTNWYEAENRKHKQF
jgi:hypothetical protein